MIFTDFIIIKNKKDSADTFTLHVKPKGAIPITPFQPGQYVKIKNPASDKPEEEHTFSIASSPNTKGYIEFYIRAYGDWTKKLYSSHVGDIIQIAYPYGDFIFDNTTDRNAVFVVGGVGISPIMSMLRFINEQQYKGNYIIIYGNRTPDTIAFKKELEALEKTIDTLKIVHIFSDIKPEYPWKGYRGFVTKDVLEKEIDFNAKPIIFIIGPPIFIDKMKALVKEFHVEEKQIKKELIS